MVFSYLGRGFPLTVGLVLLLLAACGDEAASPGESPAAVARGSALEHAAGHLDPKYVCPMHPRIVRDGPGTCPICGMDLVAKRLDPEPGKYPRVVLSGAVIRNMGVRTAAVERGTLWKTVRTLGRVEYDETRLWPISTRGPRVGSRI